MKFIDAIYAIRDKQNEYFRHANYDPTGLLCLPRKTYPQPPRRSDLRAPSP